MSEHTEAVSVRAGKIGYRLAREINARLRGFEISSQEAVVAMAICAGSILGAADEIVAAAPPEFLGEKGEEIRKIFEDIITKAREVVAREIRTGEPCPFNERETESPSFCHRSGCDALATRRVRFLVRATAKGPAATADTGIGLCDEHGSDPERLKTELLAPGFSKLAAALIQRGFAAPKLRHSEAVTVPLEEGGQP